MWLKLSIVLVILFSAQADAGEPILKENLLKAKPGDFIVAAQNKVCTLLLVQAKEGSLLTLEEVVFPLQKQEGCWQQWLFNLAPGHTCWIRYRLNLAANSIVDYYSFTQKSWCRVSQSDNLLSTLLSLSFTPVPNQERKKIGAQPSVATNDPRSLWQPPLIFNGKPVQGVSFNVWRTQWPQDNSELAGRRIEIYLPQADSLYLAYFPYWLEVQGITGRAKVRILDSGHQLKSPYPPLNP